MSNGSSAQSTNGSRGESNEDPIAKVLQDLLNGLRNTNGQNVQEVNLERAASDYAAIILRNQVQSERIQVKSAYGQPMSGGLSPVFTDLQQMVRQVRAHYLALADLEIRRMMDQALLGPFLHEESRPTANGTEPTDAQDAQFEEEEEEDSPGNETLAIEEKGSVAGTAGESASEAASGSPQDDGLYEGTVRLVVMADGNMQRVVRFVDELCQNPRLRMLRMAGSPQQQGAEIALGLREPLPFMDILAQMDNVARVESGAPGKDGEQTVTVHLATEAA